MNVTDVTQTTQLRGAPTVCATTPMASVTPTGRVLRAVEYEAPVGTTVAEEAAPILGESPALRRALAVADAVAPTTATVLVRGESGVGKELFARAIHERSHRADQPLIRVNCASISPTLFESEFFGHAKGAFTGACRDRAGRFELAHHGTLFLDEVGEIPLELQPKLLRALQEGEIERVGECRSLRVDVRVIAATNRDLREEVAAGRFRSDLYYRLNVFPIEVPPLRERGTDVLLLAEYFVAQYSRKNRRSGLTLTAEHAEQLLSRDWPGNVRELASVIERAVVLSPEPPLRLELSLPRRSVPPWLENKPSNLRTRVLTDAEIRELERTNLVAALRSCQWRIQGAGGAATLLGLSPSTLRDRMRTFGVRRDA